MRNVHQSLAFAFLYKSAGVLYPAISILLSKMAGAMAFAPVLAKRWLSHE